MVRRGGRFAMAPTGGGENASGTFRAILCNLACVRRRDEGKKLGATLAYPALFEPEPEGGFTVTSLR